MRLYTDDTRTVFIEHKGKILNWGDLTTPNGWKGTPSALFVEINAYWDTLSNASQDGLFKAYARAREAITQNSTDSAAMCSALQDRMGAIIDAYHNFEAVAATVREAKIEYPENVAVDYDSNSDRKRREMTYTKPEYFDLVVVTTILRTALPVWNMFRSYVSALSQSKSGNVSSVYVDIDTLRTLKYTDFINCPAMVRLETYVRAVADNLRQNSDSSAEMTSTVAGPGSAEVPHYLLASAIANKLITAPVNDARMNINLITSLYIKIKQDCEHLHGKFEVKVGERTDRRMGGEDDDKIGYLEGYSARQKVSDLPYVVNEVFMEDYRQLRAHIEPNVPVAVVKQLLESHQKVQLHISDVQLYLVKWIYSLAGMPRTIDDVSRLATLSGFAVSQAALLHWGFPNLAVWLSCNAIELDETIDTPLHQIQPALRAQLGEIYSYSIRTFTRAARGAPKCHHTPAGVMAIDELCNLIANYRWEVSATDEALALLKTTNGAYKIPNDIKSELAELLLILDRKYEIYYPC